jgi:hypothetical protein
MPTPAHMQRQTDRFALYYPAHEPREKDPHYKAFEKARKRILAGGVGCWICGAKEHIELHHSEVEFAAATGVDLSKFEELYPQYAIESEEEFLAWVESEGNLLALCALHHRGPCSGIHHVPEPNWKLQRFWKDGIPPPVSSP